MLIPPPNNSFLLVCLFTFQLCIPWNTSRIFILLKSSTQEKQPIRLSGVSRGPFYSIENTRLSGPSDLASNKNKIYIDVSRTGSRRTKPALVLGGWGVRTVARKEEKKRFETLVDLMNFKITRYLPRLILSEYTCGRLVRLPKFIYFHASCMSSHVCWRVLVGWIEMSHSLCTTNQTKPFFPLFFLLDAELKLCLKLHQAIFLICFQVSEYIRLLFLFFQFQRAGIWGTHSKFLFGLPKGPWMFVETPGWMDWKGHTKFILHTNRAKIIISGLVAESELCLKFHRGHLFSKNSARFLLFFSNSKGHLEDTFEVFFWTSKGPSNRAPAREFRIILFWMGV